MGGCSPLEAPGQFSPRYVRHLAGSAIPRDEQNDRSRPAETRRNEKGRTGKRERERERERENDAWERRLSLSLSLSLSRRADRRISAI